MANEIRLDQVTGGKDSFFGFSSRRYRQLASEGVLPPVVNGKVDLVRAAKDFIHYQGRLLAGQGSLNLTDVRIRKEAARADREELLVKRLKGELVPKDQAINWLTGHVTAAKLGFQSLPKRLAPVIRLKKDEKEIELEIRSEIHKILRELAKPLDANSGNNGGKKTNSK